MSRVLLDMTKAVEQHTPMLKEFGKVAGMSADAFAAAFKKDAGQALLTFVGGLSTLEERGMTVSRTMEELGIKNIRVTDTVNRLKFAHDDLVSTMQVADDEFGKNGQALDDMANRKLSTAEAALNRVKAAFNDIAIDLSNAVTPSIVAFAQSAVAVAEAARDNKTAIEAATIAIIAFGAAFVSLRLISYVGTFQAVQNALFLLTSAFGSAGSAMAALQLSAASLGTVLTSAGVVGAIYAISYALLDWYNTSKLVAEAQGNIEQANAKSSQNILKAAENYKKYGIAINTAGESENSIMQQLLENRSTLLQRMKEEQEAQATSVRQKEEHVKVVKQLTAEEQKHRDAVDKIKNSVLEATKKDVDFVNALKDLTRSGTSAHAILAELGPKIMEMGDRAGMLGTALDPAVKGLYDMATAEKVMKHDVEDSVVVLNRQLNAIVAAREASTALNKVTDTVQNQMLGQIQLNKLRGMEDIMEKIHEFQTGQTNEFAGPEDHPMFSPDALRRQSEDAKKAWQEINEKVANDFDKAFDNVFKKFAEHGKLSSKDIADFFSRAFNSVVDGVMKPFRDKFSKVISDLLTGGGPEGNGGILGGLNSFIDNFGKKLGSGLAGLFGGSSGGGLSKALGGAFSGLMSAGIASAISMGINMLSSLFGKSGSEVNNKLVKDIQNPFVKAVGDLHDSFIALQGSGKLTLQTALDARNNLSKLLSQFRSDTSAYAALGEKQATAVKNAFTEIEKYWGTDLSTIFGKIDDAIVNLGGSADMTQEGLDALTASMEKMAKFNDDVNAMVSGVTSQADNVDVMATALQKLEDAGVPTNLIINELGEQITQMADQLRTLGREVPPVISQFEQIAVAAHDLQNIEDKLKNTRQQLIDTIQRGIDANTADIRASQERINQYTSTIRTLDDSMKELSDHLHDTKYWTDEYNKVVQEAEKQYEDAVHARQSLEDQISSKTTSLQRERLQMTVDNAQDAVDAEKKALESTQASREKSIEDQIAANDKNVYLSLEARAVIKTQLEKQLDDIKNHVADSLTTEAAYLTAKKALDDFDKQQKIASIAQQSEELVKLQAALEDQLKVEEQRRIAMINSSTVISRQIEDEKSKDQAKINAMKAEEDQLKLNIIQENRRIDGLTLENSALVQLLYAAGGQHATQGIFNQIDALMSLGMEQENEANRLAALAGTTRTAANFFADLNTKLQAIITTMMSSTIGGGSTPPTTGNSGNTNSPGGLGTFNPEFPPAGTVNLPPELPPGADFAHQDFIIYTRPDGSIFSVDPNDGATAMVLGYPENRGAVGQRVTQPTATYAIGTDYVPQTGMAMLHKGEAVIPANENNGWSGGGITIKQLVINAQPGDDGRKLAQQFVRELKTNGDLRRSIRTLTDKRYHD